MSFPHETAFFDDKTEEIIYPYETSEYMKSLSGEIWMVESKEGTVNELIEKYENGNPDEYVHRLLTSHGRFTSLAYSGLLDKESKKVFEGHIISELKRERRFVIHYDQTQARFYGATKVGKHAKSNLDQTFMFNCCEIIGHSLTNPDLITNLEFNPEEYFGSVYNGKRN